MSLKLLKMVLIKMHVFNVLLMNLMNLLIYFLKDGQQSHYINVDHIESLSIQEVTEDKTSYTILMIKLAISMIIYIGVGQK